MSVLVVESSILSEQRTKRSSKALEDSWLRPSHSLSDSIASLSASATSLGENPNHEARPGLGVDTCHMLSAPVLLLRLHPVQQSLGSLDGTSFARTNN